MSFVDQGNIYEAYCTLGLGIGHGGGSSNAGERSTHCRLLGQRRRHHAAGYRRRLAWHSQLLGTVGAFTFNTGAFGFPVTNQFDLSTQSINVKSNGQAQALNIFITETNLPTLNGGTLMSSFTSNTLQNATATISSYYSSTNALYGGTLLRSTTFPAPGATSATNVVTQTGPFSLTTRYDIVFGTDLGNFNGTANITAVPEPATWAMMIAGFGLVGGTMRRRSNKIAFA